MYNGLKSTAWSAHTALPLMSAPNLAALLAAPSLQPWASGFRAVPGTHICAHCRALVLALHSWNVSFRHFHGALPSRLEPSHFTWLGFSLSQLAIPFGHFLSPLCSITIFPEHFVIMQHSSYLLVCCSSCSLCLFQLTD